MELFNLYSIIMGPYEPVRAGPPVRIEMSYGPGPGLQTENRSGSGRASDFRPVQVTTWVVWFGLSLYGHFLHTTANQTGTYCLKWIPNHYKHPSPRRESNPRTVKLKTTALAIQPQLAGLLEWEA